MKKEGLEDETFEMLLAPTPGIDIAYRFRFNPGAGSKLGAARELVSDAIDPRHGQFDPDWEGEWKVESRPEVAGKGQVVLFTIPFQTIGIDPPQVGSLWRGNFGALLGSRSAAWSLPSGTRRSDDPNAFGEIVFGAEAKGNR